MTVVGRYNNWFHPDDFDWEFDEEENIEEDKRIVKQEKEIPWRDALKKNKTRDTCILCGKKTVKTPLFTGSVKSCPCVDELKKKQDNK